MANYFVNNNPQPTGEHEVHQEGCAWMPSDKTPLGNHWSCQSAILTAKLHYRNSDGCYHCANPCHTR